MKKFLRLFLAPLCLTAACATTPTADDPGNDSAQTAAEVSQPGATTNGASCTILFPAGWSSSTANCSSGGSGSTTLQDGESITLQSTGSNFTGVGHCTITCHDGSPDKSNCTCTKKKGGDPF